MFCQLGSHAQFHPQLPRVPLLLGNLPRQKWLPRIVFPVRSIPPSIECNGCLLLGQYSPISPMHEGTKVRKRDGTIRLPSQKYYYTSEELLSTFSHVKVIHILDLMSVFCVRWPIINTLSQLRCQNFNVKFSTLYSILRRMCVGAESF